MQSIAILRFYGPILHFDGLTIGEDCLLGMDSIVARLGSPSARTVSLVVLIGGEIRLALALIALFSVLRKHNLGNPKPLTLNPKP